jgi:predicted AAA+ superfamily ATPase
MIHRVHERRLLELLDTFPVVAVLGPRQVGKSTLVQTGTELTQRRYVTLDDFDVLGAAEKDPRALLEGRGRVTVDEVQRCPGLLRAIKAEVDRDRQPGRFLLTGSSDLNLTANLAGELAGRVGVLSLPPLTWREWEGRLAPPIWLNWIDKTRIEDIEADLEPIVPIHSDVEAIHVGGYPLSVTASNEQARRDWFASYRFTYLERDVRQILNVGSLSDFSRFFQTVASRSSKLSNVAALARDVGLKAATAGRYLSVLEASFQVRRLAPWFANVGKRLVKTPKLYWQDVGLLGHLLGLTDWADAVEQSFDGPLFETFFMMEIAKQVDVFAPDMRLYFVRSHDGLEVDGVLVRGLKQMPFEIKSAATVRAEDAEPMERYMELSGSGALGLVFYRGTECRRLSRRVLAVPQTAVLG